MATQRGKQSNRWQGRGVLRSWLRNALSSGDDANRADSEPSLMQADDGTAARDSKPKEHNAVLLPFPIHGEALLVRLAELLRHRVGHLGSVREPFLFVMSRRPGSRLTIDHRSAVEFVAGRSEFRFEVDVAPNTNVVIRTGDFDALVEFVVEYVSARIAEPPSLEVAS